MQFDNCDSLCATVPCLIIYLEIDVELGQEGLGIALVLDGHKASLGVLSDGKILVTVFLDWLISSSSNA